MGDYSAGLVGLQSELRKVGYSAFKVEQVDSVCELHFKEFWQRLDWIDSELQRLLSVIEELSYIQNRIERHLNFGESLEDLI
jgi:hypothetical protein